MPAPILSCSLTPNHTAPARRSAKPRPIGLCAAAVARDTAATPPPPAERASLAANNRRARLGMVKALQSETVIAAVSIMQAA